MDTDKVALGYSSAASRVDGEGKRDLRQTNRLISYLHESNAARTRNRDAQRQTRLRYHPHQGLRRTLGARRRCRGCRLAQTRPSQAASLPAAGGFSRRAQRQVTMYRVLLERGAERDRARLSSEIHGRVIAAIQA